MNAKTGKAQEIGEEENSRIKTDGKEKAEKWNWEMVRLTVKRTLRAEMAAVPQKRPLVTPWV